MSLETKNKAIFLDRDGTIIYDKDYLSDPEQVELIAGAKDCLTQWKKEGYLLFLFTNQSGIGRGYFTIEDAIACNQKTSELLGDPNLFQETCIAPEAPEEPSKYRKPSPSFIEEMISKYNLDPNQCWMLGDRISDIQAGHNAKIHSILLKTGKPITEKTTQFCQEQKIPTLNTLKDAANQIKKCS